MREVILYDKYVLRENGTVTRINSTTANRVLSTFLSSSGKLKVTVKGTQHYVHKLVLDNFYCEGLPKRYAVAYTDGNPTNCALSNLAVIPIEEYTVGEVVEGISVKAVAVSGNKAITEDGRIYCADTEEFSYGHQGTAGYMYCYINGKKESIHRLVAKAFVPNEDTKTNTTVDHINENKKDNRAVNLRWCSVADNTKFYNDLRKDRAVRMLEDKIVKLEEKVKELKEAKKALKKEKDAIKKLKAESDRQNVVLLKETKKLARVYKHKVEFDKINKIIGKGSSTKYISPGKLIKVNGNEFSSINEAARFIVHDVLETANLVKNVQTVRKELSRFARGERPSWTMYDRYKIE